MKIEPPMYSSATARGTAWLSTALGAKSQQLSHPCIKAMPPIPIVAAWLSKGQQQCGHCGDEQQHSRDASRVHGELEGGRMLRPLAGN